MPLFKHGEARDDDEPSAGATRVLGQQAILDRLEEEIFRAGRYGRTLIVMCVLPQRLPGEDARPKETAVAAEGLSRRLRFSDRVGLLDDGTLVVVLPETSVDVARVIGHKVVSDLAVRGSRLGHAKWLVGASSFPEDGADPAAMVVAALERAKS